MVGALIFTFTVCIIIAGLQMWFESQRTYAARTSHEIHYQSARAKISNLVRVHAETLSAKHVVLVSKDEYGVINSLRWNKEVQRFTDCVVRPSLSDLEAATLTYPATLNRVMTELLEVPIADRAHRLSSTIKFDEKMSPLDFERWCAARFQKNGWKTRLTKASGDQGADIIASKKDVSLVVQCKLYTSPVGNKAVQEAHSAKTFYLSTASAVITNAGYTKSALDLARSTNVILMSEADVDRVDSLLLGIGVKLRVE